MPAESLAARIGGMPIVASSVKAFDWVGYACGLGVVALSTAVAHLMFPHFDLANLIMVYLLGVVVVASRWGRGPSLLAAIASVAAFDFLFVPPYVTFAVSNKEHLVTFAVMGVVALVISTLTVRIREQAKVARQREWRTSALYSLSRELAGTRSIDGMISAVRRHVEELFGGETAILLADDDGKLVLRGGGARFLADDPTEIEVARRVHERSEPAHGTALYLPLVGGRGPVGVLAVELVGPLGAEARQLLETFVNQTALALERALLARDAHRQRLAAEGEKLRNTLLAAVSHDLRTPLASISGAASSLVASAERLDPAVRSELALTIHEEAERMNQLVANLLEMARLQARAPTLRREWQPLEEVLGAALHQLDRHIGGRDVVLHVPDDLPLVEIDDVLMERVLVNLLENALRYSATGAPIELAASTTTGAVTVEILDRGPGLAPGEETRIFDEFVRGTAAGARDGVGLGLALARAIVEAHGGRIWAENRPDGGTAFRFTVPVQGVPPNAIETAP